MTEKKIHGIPTVNSNMGMNMENMGLQQNKEFDYFVHYKIIESV